MYEFEEKRWDDTVREDGPGNAGDWTPSAGGWLIQRMDACADPMRSKMEPRFLQIGTGQWCAPQFATLFPKRSTAEVYAKEFGYTVDRQVRVILRRF